MQVTEPSINTSGLIVIWDLHNSRVKFQAWENKQVNWALFVLGAYYNDSPICYPLIYSAQSLCLKIYDNIIVVLTFIISIFHSLFPWRASKAHVAEFTLHILSLYNIKTDNFSVTQSYTSHVL